MAVSLYEIDDAWLELEQAIMDADGEITSEIETRFESLLALRETKVENYYKLILEMESDSEKFREERERLQKKERALKNGARRLKDRLCESMRHHNEDAYETSIGTIRRVTAGGNPPVRLKVKGEAVPKRFQEVRFKVNKDALREAIEKGDEEAMTCAEIGERSEYVRMY